MITINIKGIILLSALSMLFIAGGPALLNLILALLDVDGVFIFVCGLTAGWFLHFDVGWNAAIQHKKNAAIEKAKREAREDSR